MSGGEAAFLLSPSLVSYGTFSSNASLWPPGPQARCRRPRKQITSLSKSLTFNILHGQFCSVTLKSRISIARSVGGLHSGCCWAGFWGKHIKSPPPEVHGTHKQAQITEIARGDRCLFKYGNEELRGGGRGMAGERVWERRVAGRVNRRCSGGANACQPINALYLWVCDCWLANLALCSICVNTHKHTHRNTHAQNKTLNQIKFGFSGDATVKAVFLQGLFQHFGRVYPSKQSVYDFFLPIFVSHKYLPPHWLAFLFCTSAWEILPAALSALSLSWPVTSWYQFLLRRFNFFLKNRAKAKQYATTTRHKCNIT